METLDLNKDNKKTNEEILLEIKGEYPKFKIFWEEILKQTKNSKGQVYSGTNPSPLNVVRFFAAKLATIKRWNDLYVSMLDENPKAEMPVKVYQDCMGMLQNTMGEAGDVYFGETEIINKEGKIRSLD